MSDHRLGLQASGSTAQPLPSCKAGATGRAGSLVQAFGTTPAICIPYSGVARDAAFIAEHLAQRERASVDGARAVPDSCEAAVI